VGSDAKPSPACANHVQQSLREAFIPVKDSNGKVFESVVSGIAAHFHTKRRRSNVLLRIDYISNTLVVFVLHTLAPYCTGFRTKTVIWITERRDTGELAISGGIGGRCNL
jgi:hypothetical protein